MRLMLSCVPIVAMACSRFAMGAMVVPIRRNAFVMFRRRAKARFHSRYALQRYRHGKDDGDQEAQAAKHSAIVFELAKVF